MNNISIGSSVIQSFLTQNISKLRSTTSLIISSAENPNIHKKQTPNKTDHDLEKFHHAISQQCRSIQFYTAMQYNLKTVQYGDNTLSSSFPTNANCADVKEFIRRTMGVDTTSENTIIGVGSGASIDLAKSCYLDNKLMNDNSNENDYNEPSRQHLVLIPSTLGSALAATSKKSLILDVSEEALVPSSRTSFQKSDYEHNVHVLIDPKSIAIPNWFKRPIQRTSQRRDVATILDASLASLVIALDAHLSQFEANNHANDHDKNDNAQSDIFEKCMKHSISALERILSVHKSNEKGNEKGNESSAVVISQEIKQDAIEAVLNAGQLLSFGDDMMSHTPQRRNIALALTSSLLPKYFPHGNWMTFTASLLPGMLHCLDEYDTNNGQIINSPGLKSSLEWINSEVNCSQNSSGNLIPSLSSLADGAPDVHELVSKVNHNGAFLNTIDGDPEFLEKVLFLSLNR